MGHIVNAISTRIGWFDTWKDQIYLDFSHQCDYVHHFIRIRAILVYMFFAKHPWDDFIMIFSHFDILKFRRTIQVIIHVYLGKIILFGVGFGKYMEGLIKMKGRRLRTSKVKGRWILIWLMISALDSFTRQRFEGYFVGNIKWSNKLRWYYSYSKRRYLPKNLSTLFRNHYLSYDLYHRKRAYRTSLHRIVTRFHADLPNGPKSRAHLFRWQGICWTLLSGIARWDNVRAFFRALFMEKIHRPHFEFYCEYFEYVITHIYLLSDKSAVYIQPFFNNDVTPAFVTRYMLRKLDQNYIWSHVLNPIVKELKFVMAVKRLREYGMEFKSYFKDLVSIRTSDRLMTATKFNMNLGSKLLLHIFLLESCYPWALNIVYYASAKSVLIKKYAYININSKIITVINSCWDFLHYRENDGIMNSFKYTRKAFYNALLEAFYKSFVFYFRRRDFDPFVSRDLLSINFRLMRFNYKKLSVRLPYTTDVQPQTTRFRKEFNDLLFEGFKLRMGGRLTRKQRASSYWLTVGAVPLNTFSSHMEHAFYSLPLRNSEVTIRMWFNKSPEPYRCKPLCFESNRKNMDNEAISF